MSEFSVENDYYQYQAVFVWVSNRFHYKSGLSHHVDKKPSALDNEGYQFDQDENSRHSM